MEKKENKLSTKKVLHDLTSAQKLSACFIAPWMSITHGNKCIVLEKSFTSCCKKQGPQTSALIWKILDMGLVSNLDAASKNSDGKMTDFFLKDTASDTACVMKDNEVKFKYMSHSCYDEK